MMKRLAPMMWGICRTITWALQLIGFTGLLLAALIGLYRFAAWLEGV